MVLVGFTASFVGYIAPQLNAILLSPSLSPTLKYTLDFVIWGVTMVMIWFGMSGESKMSRRDEEEASEQVRAEERQKVIAEMSERYGKDKPPTPDDLPDRGLLDSETIEVSFAGKGDVSLSHIKNIRSVKVEIPKTEAPETQQDQNEVKDEIDELLTAQATQ